MVADFYEDASLHLFCANLQIQCFKHVRRRNVCFVRWVSPEINSLNLSIALANHNSRISVAGLIRNSNDNFIAAYSFHLLTKSKVLAWVIALHIALDFCELNCLRNVMIEALSKLLFKFCYGIEQLPHDACSKLMMIRDKLHNLQLKVLLVPADSIKNLTTGAVKKGGLYALDVSTQYNYKNTLVDVKIDTDSNMTSSFTFLEVLPFTKTIATFKLPDYNSGKLEVQYFHDHAALSSIVALRQTPVVDFSASFGAHGIVFGAEAGFDTSEGTFTKYNAGVGIKNPEHDVSVILADKGDSLRASYVYHLDDKQKSSVVADINRRFSTNENTFTVGGAYAVDPQTTVKARLNNSGKLGALLQHEMKPKSILTLSGEFETKALDRSPKFGLALALKP